MEASGDGASAPAGVTEMAYLAIIMVGGLLLTWCVLGVLIWLLRPKGRTPFDRQFRVYDARVPCCYNALTSACSAVTCGVAYPWLYMDANRIYVGEVVFDERRLHFTGEAMPFCTDVCLVNQILNVLTCSLWECCGCAGKRRRLWLDNHIVSGDTQPLNEVYFFRAGPGCFRRTLAKVMSFLTCGLAYPWTETMMAARTVSEMRVDHHTAQFTGTGGDMCMEVCLVNTILSYLTCLMWECCGCAGKRERVWMDDRICVAGRAVAKTADAYATTHTQPSAPPAGEHAPLVSKSSAPYVDSSYSSTSDQTPSYSTGGDTAVYIAAPPQGGAARPYAGGGVAAPPQGGARPYAGGGVRPAGSGAVYDVSYGR